MRRCQVTTRVKTRGQSLQNMLKPETLRSIQAGSSVLYRRPVQSSLSWTSAILPVRVRLHLIPLRTRRPGLPSIGHEHPGIHWVDEHNPRFLVRKPRWASLLDHSLQGHCIHKGSASGREEFRISQWRLPSACVSHCSHRLSIQVGSPCQPGVCLYSKRHRSFRSRSGLFHPTLCLSDNLKTLHLDPSPKLKMPCQNLQDSLK